MQPVEQGIGLSAEVASFGASTEKSGEELCLVLAFGVQRIPVLDCGPRTDSQEIAGEECRREPGEGHRLLRLNLDARGWRFVGGYSGHGR